MALKQGSERFTKWSHVENGKSMIRRLHRIEVQARDGRLFILTGDSLPDYIQTNCGHGHKGEHLAQILLNPSKASTRDYEPPHSTPWPNGRDGVNVAIGFLGTIVVRFLATVVVV